MSQSGISDKKQRGMGGTIKCAPFSIHTKPKMKRWAKRLDRRDGKREARIQNADD